ncbi:HNH endonuclease [Pantoea phage Nafs113]|nr:HNH endonuclease [Pantoea phage Nafs113]
MASTNKITLEFARECFEYLGHSGELRWRWRPREHFKSDRSWRMRNSKFAGIIAGSRDTNGHVNICLDGKMYSAHCIVWLLETGVWPEHLVDHDNGIPWDNRFINLRKASSSQNAANAKLAKNNKSGIKGVSYDVHENRWRARVCCDGVTYRKWFDSLSEADEWVRIKRTDLHGDFARHV